MLPSHFLRIPALLCSFALAAQARQQITLCGSALAGARRAEQRYLYETAQLQRFAATGSVLSLAPSPAQATGVAEVGDLVVMDDSDGVRIRRNPFNLQLKRLFFKRTPAGAYTVEAGAGTFDSAASATKLDGLEDDDFRQVPLPFSFPFYAGTYTSVFINSDGNLTFGEGDNTSSDRSISRMIAGAPRISPLYADLDPSQSREGVRVLSQPDRFLVSWVNVPFYGSFRTQNVQAALFPNGDIEVVYGDTSIVLDEVVVGISPGSFTGETRIIPLGIAAGDVEYAATVAEVFAGRESYDVARAIQRFYVDHDDAYDNIFVFNALGQQPSLCPAAIACTDVIRNRVTGVGARLTDDAAIYGSPKRLEAVIDMGSAGNYPNNPEQEHPQRPGTGDTGFNIWGHEASHRYLAYVSPREGGAQILLGRQGAHWNFAFNSEGSLVEGNRLIDEGDGANPRFFSAGAGERVAPLDQYFFGWRAPRDVPPTFVVLNSGYTNSSAPPRPGTRFNGVRRDVTIEELIPLAGGPRFPDHEIAPRSYRWATIVITREGEPLPAALIDRIERYRAGLPAKWDIWSEGRSQLDTSLKRSLDVSFGPWAEWRAGVEMKAALRIRRPAEADLRITVDGPGEIIGMPAELIIPAGATQVEFTAHAASLGVQTLVFRPSDPRFETQEARVRVK